jgi:hypothetical protein
MSAAAAAAAGLIQPELLADGQVRHTCSSSHGAAAMLAEQ